MIFDYFNKFIFTDTFLTFLPFSPFLYWEKIIVENNWQGF